MKRATVDWGVWLVFILMLVLIVVVIWWTLYQWNTCMEKIGDIFYCWQHIA